jgi:hypothetical protein
MKLLAPQVCGLLLVVLSSTVSCQKAQTNVPAGENRLVEQTTTELVPVPSPTLPPKQEVTLDPGWELKPKEFEDVNRRLRYSLKGRYPVVSEATDARARRLNKEIRRSIAKRYSYMMTPDPKEFRDHVRAFPKEDILETAEVDYEVMESTKGFLSIRFYDTTYSLGAAHPLQGYFTVNYLTGHGRVMKIEDVFNPRFDHLKFLSWFCTESIGVMEPWKHAVTAKPGSFESWNIKGESLVINFDRCEVTACADGARTVVIPFEEFRAHVNKRNPYFQ